MKPLRTKRERKKTPNILSGKWYFISWQHLMGLSFFVYHPCCDVLEVFSGCCERANTPCPISTLSFVLIIQNESLLYIKQSAVQLSHVKVDCCRNKKASEQLMCKYILTDDDDDAVKAVLFIQAQTEWRHWKKCHAMEVYRLHVWTRLKGKRSVCVI